MQSVPGAVVGAPEKDHAVHSCLKFASEVRKNQLFCRFYCLQQILIAALFIG